MRVNERREIVCSPVSLAGKPGNPFGEVQRERR